MCATTSIRQATLNIITNNVKKPTYNIEERGEFSMRLTLTAAICADDLNKAPYANAVYSVYQHMD